MNITVYLGANEGNDPSLRKAVRELGTWCEFPYKSRVIPT